jgi:hypothetical protein
MASFICFDCNKIYLNEFHEPKYRTFADSGNSTINDEYYRICKYCSYSNKINNLITIIVFFIFFSFLFYFNYFIRK